MFLSRVLFAFLALLIGFAAAAPIIRSNSDLDLVARAPIKALERAKHAVQAAKIALKVSTKLKPQAGKTVFWSGTSPPAHPGDPRVSAFHAARDHAAANGGRTIYDELRHVRINRDHLNNNHFSGKLWDHASKVLAKKASGEVHVFVGETRRPGSVYDRIEKPALMRNNRVTHVWEHNTHTGQVTNVKT